MPTHATRSGSLLVAACAAPLLWITAACWVAACAAPLLWVAACAAPAARDLPLHPDNVAWKEQDCGLRGSLRGVSAVDARTCWVSGSEGGWAVTSDGGATWTHGVVPGAAARDFRDVEGFSERRALLMAVASPAELWLTEDGGATWRRTYRDEHPDAFLDALAFWDDRFGLAFGDPLDGVFTLLRTSDGGETWTRVPAADLPAPLPSEAGFAASGTCVTVGTGGRAWIVTGGGAARVLSTTDFGATWSAAETPLTSGHAGTGGFSIVALGDGRLSAVGGDYERPEDTLSSAVWSEDQGRTWRASRDPLPGYRSAVVALHAPYEGTLLSISKAGVSLSPDAGRTWAPLPGPTCYALDLAPPRRVPAGRKASAPEGSTGWAVGADGRVVRLDVRPPAGER